MKPADVAVSNEDRGRFSARRKSKAILRLLRGEDIDVVSRELGVTAATVSVRVLVEPGGTGNL